MRKGDMSNSMVIAYRSNNITNKHLVDLAKVVRLSDKLKEKSVLKLKVIKNSLDVYVP